MQLSTSPAVSFEITISGKVCLECAVWKNFQSHPSTSCFLTHLNFLLCASGRTRCPCKDQWKHRQIVRGQDYYRRFFGTKIVSLTPCTSTSTCFKTRVDLILSIKSLVAAAANPPPNPKTSPPAGITTVACKRKIPAVQEESHYKKHKRENGEYIGEYPWVKYWNSTSKACMVLLKNVNWHVLVL